MGLIIGVLGASGGVGASTLTAALVERAHSVLRSCAATVAVDLDPRGGLDVVLCREHLDGTRWLDLERGGRESPVTLAELPGDAQVRFLAGTGGPAPEWMCVGEALSSLAAEADLVAIDCGMRPEPALLSRLDLLVVLARLTAKGAADAAALGRVSQLARTERVLVTRGIVNRVSTASAAALARELDIPLLCHLADDPRVPHQAAVGLSPAVVRSAVDGCADEALVALERAWLLRLVGR